MTEKQAGKIARKTNRFRLKDVSKPNPRGVTCLKMCVGKPLCERKGKSKACPWCFSLMSDDERWYDEVSEAMDRKH